MTPFGGSISYAAGQARRHNRGVRYQFVDCRWELGNPGRGRELYLAGHIPGASFLDVEEDLSSRPGERGRHPLPEPDAFAEAASRAGIGENVLVVAYGNMGGAERLWWLLRHFGHEQVGVLAGGIESWRGRLSEGEEEIERGDFATRPRTDDTISANELAARLDDPDLIVVDARTPERFRGEPNPIDKVPGRVPGALNVPYVSDEPLPEEILAAKEIAVYCGSGVTACVTLHELAEAGRADAKLYPGSWSEWEGLGLPVQR
jgi:thiosulfate/3-mercaptopyruvate sulfurtransferase